MLTIVHSSQEPYLTSAFLPIPGKYKSHYDDFIVEEIPAYLPSGKGEHVYLHIEKRGLASKEAAQRLCRFARLSYNEVGLAGLKDSRALSRQWLSLRTPKDNLFAEWKDPAVRILQSSRHGNKLRIGHLKGNYFLIKLRDVPADRLEDIQNILKILTKRGVPNYFGMQRFGYKAANPAVGKALLDQDYKTVAARIFEQDFEADLSSKALEFAVKEEWEQLISLCNASRQNSRKICLALQKNKDYRKAVYELGMDKLWFYITSYQSYLFNRVLARRLSSGSWDKLLSGDLAFKHDSGAVFLVEDPEKEQVRCDRLEISPSGPLFGFKMTEPTQKPAEIEQEVLQEQAITLEKFYQPGRLKCQGARRSLRFELLEATVRETFDEKGPCIEIKFRLPAGCFATTVLREIGKEALTERT